MPRDIRDGFVDDVRDFAQDSARNLEVGALLGPGETAVYRMQHGLGVAAGFFQRPDAVLQVTDAIGKSDGAVDRPTGGLLEDLQVLGARPGKEWQEPAGLRRRRKERQPLRFGCDVLPAEFQDVGASFVESLRAPAQPPQRPRGPSLPRRAMPARRPDRKHLA